MKGEMVLFLNIYLIFIFMYHSIVVSSSFYFLTLLKTKVTELKIANTNVVLRLFFPLKKIKILYKIERFLSKH